MSAWVEMRTTTNASRSSTPPLRTLSRPPSRSAVRSRRSSAREDAERFIEEVRGDDPEAEVKLRIEERELEAGGLKSRETGDDGQPSNPVVRIDATVS